MTSQREKTNFPEKTVFDEQIADNLEETIKNLTERPVLITLDGGDANRRHSIDKPEIGIGRDITSDIVLQDTRSSRNHARLIYKNYDQIDEPPQIQLQDLDSTNGSFVNGERISEHLLLDRDKILLGSTLFGYFMRDEFELQADQRMYIMARNDALTGLLNRGVFDMEMQKEFDRARRYTRALSLVLFDIDHFKRFNDSYGHQMGDWVLQELGNIVRANVRGNDLGARYGGEEFAIILPETTLEGALIQAERLRVSVNSHGFQNDGTSVQLSVSLGVAAIEPEIKQMEALIKASDQALYQAKAEGRNCICWMRNGVINSGSSTQ